MTIEKLKKRDGRLVSFDKEKIARAIAKPSKPPISRARTK